MRSSVPVVPELRRVAEIFKEPTFPPELLIETVWLKLMELEKMTPDELSEKFEGA
jgi:hypothetical protein